MIVCQEQAALYQQLYGSNPLVPGTHQPGTRIIESAAVMELQHKAKLNNTSHPVTENGIDKMAVVPPKATHEANGDLSNGSRVSW